jgi:acyl-coenzyme A thioesterase PaaI-like protein
MAAPLCIASPETGGMDDDKFVPNPVIHSMQVLDEARGVTRVEMHAETIHQGRTMAFSRTRIVDADNPSRVIALSSGMGVSLGQPPEGFEPVDNPSIELEDAPDLPPLYEVFGATRRRDGRWALPELSPEMASPDAALHLGPIHIVLETAAMDVAAEAMGTNRLQVEDWYVMFVARGKVGPFRAEGQVIPGPTGRVGVSLALVDEGNGNRVVTSGSATFRVQK